MNERIRELVRQTVITVDDPFPGNPLNDELEKMYIPDCFAEKFAELIIRECISTIENAENGYQDYRNQIEDGMRNHCISLITNKFGVEE